MNKLLIICGPTATGKTSLALKLAKIFDGEIISVDSRQVYKDMNIGTGKDLPENAEYIFVNSKIGGYYLADGIKIWGYDLASPKDQFSVAQYIKIATSIIADIGSRKKLPILVGGTGLYIKGVIDGIPTVNIPRNDNLRRNLIDKSVEELFELLANLDPIKAGSLNSSDKQNPRRLYRAIEIAQYLLENQGKNKFNTHVPDYNTLIIGLTSSLEELFTKIKSRVISRIKEGQEKEIFSLLKSGVSWSDQSMASLGYRQWKDYFEKKESKDVVVEKWISEEKRYAKRQLVWFKKDKRINWFDIKKDDSSANIENLVQKWYSSP